MCLRCGAPFFLATSSIKKGLDLFLLCLFKKGFFPFLGVFAELSIMARAMRSSEADPVGADGCTSAPEDGDKQQGILDHGTGAGILWQQINAAGLPPGLRVRIAVWIDDCCRFQGEEPKEEEEDEECARETREGTFPTRSVCC